MSNPDHDPEAADTPIPYMARTRAYYAAIGYTTPYRWAHNVAAPFAPLRKPLAQSRIALVTTAAPYQPDKGDQGPGAPYNGAAKFYDVYAKPTDTDPELRISHIGYDRIHTSATEAGIRTALAAAGFEARVIEASWFGDRTPALPLGEAFHSKRLRLISSQVGHVAPPMRPRRSHGERLALALDLLANPVLDRLLEPPTHFHRMPEAMPRLLAHGLCHVITYGTP